MLHQPLAHHDRLLGLTEQGNFSEEALWPDFELQDITD